MSSTSYSKLSIPTTSIDVPEPISITGRFQYNFYLSDEDKQYHITPTSPFVQYSDTPESLNMVSTTTADLIEEKERGAIRNRIPRYIELSISPNTADVLALPLNTPYQPTSANSKVWYTGRNSDLYKTLKGHPENINVEGNIENGYNVAVGVQDASAKTRNQKLIYRLSTAKVENGTILGETSPTDIAAALDDMTSEDVDATSIINMLSDVTPLGQTYVNDISAAIRNPLDEKAAIRYNVKFNAQAYQTAIAGNMVANPFTVNYLSDVFGHQASNSIIKGIEFNPILNTSIYPTSNEVSQEVTADDVSPVLTFLERDRTNRRLPSGVGVSNDAQVLIRHIGFQIDKTGKSPKGESEIFDSEILLNPDEVSFIDPKVKYGFTYTYKVKQLFLITHYVRVSHLEQTAVHSSEAAFAREQYGIDSYESSEYTKVTYVVASRSPTPLTISAKEKTPPPSPSVLFCRFIYEKGNGIHLEWQLPVYNTRDVKKYQVFRRKTIEEPFTCIAEYDFTDDGYTQFTQTEIISPEVVHKVDFPRYYHIDYDFERDSDYIYCIVAIDAHGLSSNLGVQMRAKYDAFTNKLILKKISAHDAPKAYPNMYLEGQDLPNSTLTEDVAADSNHHTLRLYFNPDVYHYTRDQLLDPELGISGGTFQTKESIVLPETKGTYKFQIINLDRQKTKILEVKVDPQESLLSIL